ncbi:hypothetical protein [Pseudoxanthomonas winnipegensis]
MKKMPVTLGVFVLAAAVSASVRAQQAQAAAAQGATEQNPQDARATKAKDLDRMIVTGTRAPKAVDKIPGAISVISPQEVAQTLAVTEDATAVLARTVPG